MRGLFGLLAILLFSIGLYLTVFVLAIDHNTRELWGFLFAGLDAYAIATVVPSVVTVLRER